MRTLHQFFDRTGSEASRTKTYAILHPQSQSPFGSCSSCGRDNFKSKAAISVHVKCCSTEVKPKVHRFGKAKPLLVDSHPLASELKGEKARADDEYSSGWSSEGGDDPHDADGANDDAAAAVAGGNRGDESSSRDDEVIDEFRGRKKRSGRKKYNTLVMKDKIRLLDYYHSCERSYQSTKAWVLDNFKFTLRKSTLNSMLKSEPQWRRAVSTHEIDSHQRKRIRRINRRGKYPELEKKLFEWIKLIRADGNVVCDEMVIVKAMTLMKEMHPDAAAAAEFKYSKGWLFNFYDRFALSHRTMTSDINLTTEQQLHLARHYHLNLRKLATSAPPVSPYGCFSPLCIFNIDQVPLELADQHCTTLDFRGTNNVWVKFPANSKRFATLNLTITHTLADGLDFNCVKPHIIFEGSSAGRLLERERHEYAAGVYVTFQESAWLDSVQYATWLEHVFKPVADKLGSTVVLLRDNLSVYFTEMSQDAEKRFVPNLVTPMSPSNMTSKLQPIDRHIGVRYKEAIVESIRKWKCDNPDKALSAAIKRVIVTQAVARCHEANKGAWNRAFIATGSFLKLDSSQDSQVDMQGFRPKPGDDPSSVYSYAKSIELAESEAPVDFSVKKRGGVQKDEAATSSADVNHESRNTSSSSSCASADSTIPDADDIGAQKEWCNVKLQTLDLEMLRTISSQLLIDSRNKSKQELLEIISAFAETGVMHERHRVKDPSAAGLPLNDVGDGTHDDDDAE